MPVPTIGWLTWHVEWWWSTAIDVVADRPLRTRTDVVWPGSGGATIAGLRALAAQWREVLRDMDTDRLARPSAFPWGADTDRTVADTALWLNVELTKNIAEIGQLRLLRAVHD